MIDRFFTGFRLGRHFPREQTERKFEPGQQRIDVESRDFPS